jgi:hypothetical protein
MNPLKKIRNQIRRFKYTLEFEQGIITAERPYDPTLKQGTISYYNIEK